MSILFINSHTSRLPGVLQLKCFHVISAKQYCQQSLNYIVTGCSILERNTSGVLSRWALINCGYRMGKEFLYALQF